MAVKIPDAGLGDGNTGDNEYIYRKKVQDNFTEQTNAASRLVGTAANQIPLAQDAFKAAFAKIEDYSTNQTLDLNNLDPGKAVLVSTLATNSPPSDGQTSYWAVMTVGTYGTNQLQIAYGYNNAVQCVRAYQGGGWSAWAFATKNQLTYTTTTASGANVVVDTTGKLMRSTSSERYKNIIADLALDDVAYANAMKLAPIVYRSTADADNPAYHYYSFSAEALGAFDPAFTLWRETELVTDADGNTTEQPLAERQAEGININALLAFSHAIAIKQDKMIKAQSEAIATLTKRIDAMAAQ